MVKNQKGAVMKRSSFKETISIIGHAFAVAWQVIRSARQLRNVRMPAVTIWGGTHADKESFYAQQAYAFAQKLVTNNISVLTGGGPGIMEAANCGATQDAPDDGMLSSMGINVSFVDKAYENPCVPVLRVDYFFLRKWLLIRYSLAFIIFPGGVGTADELFELLNFIKHGKVPMLPVVLIGTEYWQPMIDWLESRAFKHGFVKQYQLDALTVTDDLEYAFSVVREACDTYRKYVS